MLFEVGKQGFIQNVKFRHELFLVIAVVRRDPVEHAGEFLLDSGSLLCVSREKEVTKTYTNKEAIIITRRSDDDWIFEWTVCKGSLACQYGITVRHRVRTQAGRGDEWLR